MSSLAEEQVRSTVDALLSGDRAQTKLLTYLLGDPKTAEPGVDLILIPLS